MAHAPTPREEALQRLAAAVERLERAVDARAGGSRADVAADAALAELDRTIAQLKTLVGEDTGHG